jgi:hypothetical protein
VQAVDDGQDTPARDRRVPGGLGMDWILHFVPFQRSATTLPMAVHAPDDEQDTARSDERAPGGLGMDWMFHFVPFHASARTWEGEAVGVEFPTAMQATADQHETPSREALLLARSGVGWIVHAPPSHRSARTWPAELVK